VFNIFPSSTTPPKKLCLQRQNTKVILFLFFKEGSDIDDPIKWVAFKEQKPFNSFLLDTQLRWATLIACEQLWWLVEPLAGFLTLGGAGYTKQNFPPLSSKVVPILHRGLCSFMGDYTFTF
jgi:hypothetical protein